MDLPDALPTSQEPPEAPAAAWPWLNGTTGPSGALPADLRARSITLTNHDRVEGAAHTWGVDAPQGARRGRGRNTTLQELRLMILAALDLAGGEQYLLKQAQEEPKAFLSLLARLIPLKLQGDAESPLVARIERVIIGAPVPPAAETTEAPRDADPAD